MRRRLALLLMFLAWPCGLLQAGSSASRVFDALSGSLGFGSAAAFDDLTTMTVTAWVYYAGAGENNRGYIMSKFDGLAGWVLFANNLTPPTHALECFVEFGANDLTHRGNNNTISANVWTHVALTWDGSVTAANAKIYTNGTEIAYQTTTNATGTRPTDGALNLVGGNRAADDRTWNGNLSNLALFNVILTSAEIAQEMWHPGSILRGRIGYWPVYGTDSPEGDLSGNGNPGTVSGTATSALGPPIFFGGISQ